MSVTPICDFLEEYRRRGTARLHMPGHKGRRAMSGVLWEELPFSLDITEVAGADALFEAEGIIGRSESVAAGLYGTRHTCFSAGGSTLSILAMTAAAKRRGGRLLAVRNAHVALIHACILLDWQPAWLCPEYDPSTGLARPVTAGEVAAAMDRDPGIRAVYLTSPDYFGREADVAAIAGEVHRRGAILLVDNAHGAHLRFLPRDRHPMTLGADLCCDSAHKTLPALTGAGYLHSNLPGDKWELKADMALFGSTSPSYLILASLDLCNAYLSGPAREEFAALEARTAEWEDRFRREGAALLPGKTDPTKLTLDCQAMGYSHEEAAARLREQGVEPEYAGGGKIVLMLSPQTPEADLIRTPSALLGLPRKAPLSYAGGCPSPDPVMTLREAAFAPWEEVPLAESGGRVAAETRITCPPAIPVIAAGERIGKTEKNLLQNSGIFSIKVVK